MSDVAGLLPEYTLANNTGRRRKEKKEEKKRGGGGLGGNGGGETIRFIWKARKARS